MAIPRALRGIDQARRAPATLIASVQRALRLLEAASVTPNGAPAKQLARAVGLPLGTTYHLLRTLAFEGYLRRLADGTYIVGDQIQQLLEHSSTQATLRRTRPPLTALRDAAHAAAYLAFYENGEIVVKDVQDGPRTPRIDLWVGFRDAGHATALGKSILAGLDAEALNDYLARHRLNELTARTITNRQTLLQSLEEVRLTGLAVDDEEYLPGNACVAAPIATPGSAGAVAISLPRRRLTELRTIGPLLQRTAERIARSHVATGLS